jgi:hypothetical protein
LLTDEFWRGYRKAAGLHHDDYDVVAFGDGPDMATELAELTVAGIKRATAGLVRQFGPDGEPPPVVGGYVVLLDGAKPSARDLAHDRGPDWTAELGRRTVCLGRGRGRAHPRMVVIRPSPLL